MEHHAPTVSSAIFSNVFRKRSFVTPAYCHPRAEQEEIDKARLNESSSFGTDPDADTPASLAADIGARFFGRYDAKRKVAPSARHAEDLESEEVVAAGESVTRTGGFSGGETEIYELLSEKPLSVDKLCDLTGMPAEELSVSLLILELSKLVNREPGDYYVRCKPDQSHEVASLSLTGDDSNDKTAVTVTAAIQFIIEHCHGISRKYLQNYLAAYWCYSDRVTWSQGSLLQLCRQSPRIIESEILGYVSPPMVVLIS